jgi:UDP-glucose 4-epimerase
VVLVTGGAGFIGANLVRALIASGERVRVLDDMSVGTAGYLDGLDLELEVGEIGDAEVAFRACADCSAVVHLAARSAVLESVADPWPTFETNARGTLTLLRAAVDAGVERFILASSNAALGEYEPPLDEKKVPRPISPYGASKLAAEGYCSAFHGSYGLRTISLRFANAYGPFSHHKTSVVAKFTKALLAGEGLTIYGDGSQTRDFIFVDDIVAAVMNSLAADVGCEVLQIATGHETSVRELVALLGEITSKDVVLEWLPQPSGEIRRNYASIERAGACLGWRPKVRLREGLEATVAAFSRADD